MILLAKSNMDVAMEMLGIHEFMPNGGWVFSAVGSRFCAMFASICGDLIASITSADKELDNYDRYDVLAGHDPAGTSV